MTQVFQTKFGLEGNCWAACLASIMEVDLESIPDFTPEACRARGLSDDWFVECCRWIKDRFGLSMTIQLPPANFNLESLHASYILQDGVHSIVGGKSPRGYMHAVIFNGTKMVHDPHPEGGGIESVKDITLFVAPEPWKFRSVPA